MSLAQQQELESKYVMGTFARKPVEFVSGNGMTLTDEESRIYTQMNLRVGTLRRDELTTYRGLLKRLYRANSERRAYDPKLLRKRLVYRYKLACKCFYPSWTVKIRKRLLWLELR